MKSQRSKWLIERDERACAGGSGVGRLGTAGTRGPIIPQVVLTPKIKRL